MELNKKEQKEIDTEFDKYREEVYLPEVVRRYVKNTHEYVYKKLIEMKIERDAALKAGQKQCHDVKKYYDIGHSLYHMVKRANGAGSVLQWRKEFETES